MAFTLPDPATDFGARVARRLRDEVVAWFTVVDATGTPQPAPVWFLWDGESILIYSHGQAKRLEHLAVHPRVSFHFDGDGAGGNIVVLTGSAEVVRDEPPANENQAYLAKYGSRITDGWTSAENFASIYSVPVRFRPRRVRGH